MSLQGDSKVMYSIKGDDTRTWVPMESSSDPLPVEFEDEDEDDGEANIFIRSIGKVQGSLHSFKTKHGQLLRILFYATLILLYAIYFSYAMYYKFGDEGSIRLLWVTILVLIGFIYYLIKLNFGEQISDSCRPCTEKMALHESMISW